VNVADDPSAWVFEKELDREYDGERHRRERADRGFSEYDWWNFNDYLAWVILGGLKKFRKKGNSFPAQFQSEHEWNLLLDEMINGFEYYCSSDDINKLDDARWKRAWELFHGYFASLWD
jgi:hypothetical protein